ncbi:MAG: hypothetical protein HY574_09120 [candidate division NC10 bacterium]|nr:hypothetical protein [candidate division NC10 bacterium]
MNPYRLLGCFGLALILVGQAFPVEAQSPVSLRVLLPGGPFPTVEGGPTRIMKQGSTVEVRINVDGSNPRFHPDNVEAVWVGEQRMPSEFPSRIGPRVSIPPTRGDVRRTAVSEPISLPAELFSCGRHNLRAVAEFRGRHANIASPEPATTVFLDCGPPGLEIHAPSGGACIRPGTGIDLRLTASDDIGIKGLTRDLGPLGRQHREPTTLERTFALSERVAVGDPHRNGVISAGFEAEDWAGNRLAKGLTFTLDGDVPPTIGMERPSDGQQVTQVDSIAVSGQAADPGCGLDRIEIGARRRGTSDPYRIVKAIREFPPARSGLPTPRFTYRADLPPGTLAPGLWDLRAEAISQTGRRAESARHIRVIGGPTLALSAPGGRESLPGVPRPTLPPPR